MASSVKNTMIIAEQDNDLSSCLTLFFSPKFNVVAVRELDEIEKHLESARILLIEAKILENAGFELLNSLKKRFPNLAVVVMGTAWSKENWKEEFVKNHADAVVYKPFDVGRISRIISQFNTGNYFSTQPL